MKNSEGVRKRIKVAEHGLHLLCIIDRKHFAKRANPYFLLHFLLRRLVLFVIGEAPSIHLDRASTLPTASSSLCHLLQRFLSTLATKMAQEIQV